MSRQKGQSLVEFALIVPIFFLMCFAMIYGGMLFMDYLQWNNAARGVARAISLAQSDEQRETIAADFENHNSVYIKQLTKLYKANPKISKPIGPNNVTVEVDLTLNSKDLPLVLNLLKFPPQKLNPVKIIMPIENIKTSSTE